MTENVLTKPRLRRWEAVDYLEAVHGLPTTVATLAKLACGGGGPSFQKMGRVVLYPVVELDRWAIGRISATRRNTSDSGVFPERDDDRGVGDRPRQSEPIAI